ncbi:Hypothetical predicted protein, partial [Paramuricea clavata]
EWRNFPKANGISPAQLLIGRKQRGLLPTVEVDNKKRDRVTNDVTQNRSRSRCLCPLQIGDEVRIQNAITKKWDELGIITSKRNNGRSFWIKTKNGWQILRNRRFLKKETKRTSNRDGSPETKREKIENSRIDPRRSERISRKESIGSDRNQGETDTPMLQ